MAKVDVTCAKQGDSVATRLLADFSRVFEQIQKRAYEFFEERGRQHGADMEDWLRAEEDLLCPATLESRRDSEKYTIELRTTGFAAKDLNVYTLGDKLLVTGELNQISEKQGETFEKKRALFYEGPLPTGSQESHVTAEYKNGVLSVNIPLDLQQERNVEIGTQPMDDKGSKIDVKTAVA